MAGFAFASLVFLLGLGYLLGVVWWALRDPPDLPEQRDDGNGGGPPWRRRPHPPRRGPERRRAARAHQTNGMNRRRVRARYSR